MTDNFGSTPPDDNPEDFVDSELLPDPEARWEKGSQHASSEPIIPGLPSSAPPVHQNTSDYKFSEQSLRAMRLLQEGMNDPGVDQLDGYGPNKFSAQIEGVNRLLNDVAFSSDEDYTMWLKQVVESAGDVTTWEILEEKHMGVLQLKNGARAQIMFDGVTKVPTFSFRKHTAEEFEPFDFVKNGSMSTDMMDFLIAAIKARVNILFVGSQGSGKTTLMRALLNFIGREEKVAVVEQVPELRLKQPLVVPYQYQPTVEGIQLKDVLDYNLYNGLSRLIVGEIHLEGITKMIETMIVSEGSMSTYHAFSTEQAGERMKLALQLEHSNVSAETALALIRNAIEMVVVLERVEGNRRVTQITEIDWRSSGGSGSLGGNDLFKFDRNRNMFIPTGTRPDEAGRIIMKARDKYHVNINPDWFINPDDLERLNTGV